VKNLKEMGVTQKERIALMSGFARMIEDGEIGKEEMENDVSKDAEGAAAGDTVPDAAGAGQVGSKLLG
jgi:hypothetical protein